MAVFKAEKEINSCYGRGEGRILTRTGFALSLLDLSLLPTRQIISIHESEVKRHHSVPSAAFIASN